MPNADKFGLLRKLLKAIGLKEQAIDEIVDRIVELLSGEPEKEGKAEIYPYHLRDDFLSAAEHSFYLVLRQAVEDWAVICPKVSLSGVFTAKSNDYGEYRTYTNKIDRKHIDFLVCEPGTLRPVAGIELDDKSHERSDRQARHDFVKHVFDAAGLPLVRVRVRREYPLNEFREALRSRLGLTEEPAAAPVVEDEPPVDDEEGAPTCPKCGSPMALRRARRGANAGQQIWGCAAYPSCRTVVPYAGSLYADARPVPGRGRGASFLIRRGRRALECPEERRLCPVSVENVTRIRPSDIRADHYDSSLLDDGEAACRASGRTLV